MSVDKEHYGHSTYYMESRMKTEGIEKLQPIHVIISCETERDNGKYINIAILPVVLLISPHVFSLSRARRKADRK